LSLDDFNAKRLKEDEFNTLFLRQKTPAQVLKSGTVILECNQRRSVNENTYMSSPKVYFNLRSIKSPFNDFSKPDYLQQENLQP